MKNWRVIIGSTILAIGNICVGIAVHGNWLLFIGINLVAIGGVIYWTDPS